MIITSRLIPPSKQLFRPYNKLPIIKFNKINKNFSTLKEATKETTNKIKIAEINKKEETKETFTEIKENPSTKHAIPIYTNKTLIWIPPKKETSKDNSILSTEGTEKDFIFYLPPPPRHNLNSQIKEHREKEEEILRILDERLPPNDIFRIPVICNKPWFTVALWSYCFVVGVCVVLFGKWDELNEGVPHCFQPIQSFAKKLWEKWNFVDPLLEAELVTKKLESVNKS